MVIDPRVNQSQMDYFSCDEIDPAVSISQSQMDHFSSLEIEPAFSINQPQMVNQSQMDHVSINQSQMDHFSSVEIDPAVSINQPLMDHSSSVKIDPAVSIPNLEWEFRFLDRLKWDAQTGAPLATLLAQVILFAASLCLKKTRLRSEYDHSGIKTAILYHICAVLLCYTNRCSRLGFFRKKCGVKVNSIANLICLILGILLEKLYEKSLASLCLALSMVILFLILVVIIQPRTDLGFFGFLIGVTGSIAYNLFQLNLGTWIVVAICFVLLCFKRWLDKNWLELEGVELEHGNIPLLTLYRNTRIINSGLINPVPAPVIQSIDALMVAGFYLVWASAFLSTNCLNLESCASCSAMEKLKCGAIYVLWVSPAHIHRVYSLFQVEFWVLWPKTLLYTRAILKMECIRNNIKREKEKRHRMHVSNFELVKIKEAWETTKDEAFKKLPKWVRKSIKSKRRHLITEICKMNRNNRQLTI